MTYNLITKKFDELINENKDDDIKNHFWDINFLLIENIYKYFNLSVCKKILDVGGALDNKFKYATDVLDIIDSDYKIDLDIDKFPFIDKEFDFIYCRHTLEDIQNPDNAFKEIIRTSKKGYIETPSPIVECMNNVDGNKNSKNYRGYIHHRYIVWTDIQTNTLYFLPKYPIIECLTISVYNNLKYILNNYPIYWNNYYYWDEKNLPNIFVYKHGVNMNILKDYSKLIETSFIKFFEYTYYFINKIK